MRDVFIFSGTTEGRTLARWLAARGVMVHVRVATDYGAEVMDRDENIEVQVGSCGGAEGIAEVIRDNMYDLVVDATHPYATTVSRHIREACESTGAEYIRIRREDSDVREDSDIVVVGSVQEAVDFLKGTSGRILAATGSKEIDLYTQIPDYRDRVVARVLSTVASVQRCAEFGFEGRNLIAGQGPFPEDVNHATLQQIGARYMVTKDSGAVGGYEEKVRAARRAGVTVVLVSKPDDSGVPYREAVAILEDRLGLPHEEPKEVGLGRRSLSVVGIGMGGDSVTVAARDRIRGSDLLVGARRMLDSVDTHGKDVLEEYRSDRILDYLGEHREYRRVTVLVSGDVGFYSGATKILEQVDRDEFDVHVEPGISSMVYMCAKAGTPWQDVTMVSGHGREANFVGLANTHPKLFTLLSGEDSVHDMCRQLFDYGMHDVRITVGQDFGLPTERIVTGTPSEILETEFGDLCVALIENGYADERCPISIPDDYFIRGDAPMTKSEVRALSVAKLKLAPDSVVYDIGAGTGSVSIEMAMVAYSGKVYAVEKEEAAATLIEINRNKFRVPNIEVVRGTAPDALADLPAPTHAFIGGSAGNLKEIVLTLLGKNPDVRMVINSVTVETLTETFNAVKDLKLVEEDITSINVSKSKKVGRYHLMTAQNPVYIAVVRGR